MEWWANKDQEKTVVKEEATEMQERLDERVQRVQRESVHDK